MWIAIFIVLLVIYIFWRFAWAIVEPIFTFVYETIVDLLMGLGLSYNGARAFISVMAIFVIMIIVLS